MRRLISFAFIYSSLFLTVHSFMCKDINVNEENSVAAFISNRCSNLNSDLLTEQERQDFPLCMNLRNVDHSSDVPCSCPAGFTDSNFKSESDQRLGFGSISGNMVKYVKCNVKCSVSYISLLESDDPRTCSCLNHMGCAFQERIDDELRSKLDKRELRDEVLVIQDDIRIPVHRVLCYQPNCFSPKFNALNTRDPILCAQMGIEYTFCNTHEQAACAPGSFLDGDEKCQTCRTCLPSEEETRTCSPSHNRICKPKREIESPTAVQNEILLGNMECQNNKVWNNRTQACQNCPDNYEKKNNLCSPCPQHTTRRGSENTLCVPCPELHFRTKNDTTCKMCPDMKYFDKETETCKECGHNQIFVHMVPECVPCANLFYSDESKTTCLPCQAGLVQNQQAAGCSFCDVGKSLVHDECKECIVMENKICPDLGIKDDCRVEYGAGRECSCNKCITPPPCLSPGHRAKLANINGKLQFQCVSDPRETKSMRFSFRNYTDSNLYYCSELLSPSISVGLLKDNFRMLHDESCEGKQTKKLRDTVLYEYIAPGSGVSEHDMDNQCFFCCLDVFHFEEKEDGFYDCK